LSDQPLSAGDSTCFVQGTVLNLTDRELAANPVFSAFDANNTRIATTSALVTLRAHERKPYSSPFFRDFNALPSSAISSVAVTKLETCAPAEVVDRSCRGLE
jgi:hypothetical protein